MQISAQNGHLNWLQRNPILDATGVLSCLDYSSGVVGCGDYVDTQYVFKMNQNGATLWMYEFTGDNPGFCSGIFSTSTEFWVLINSNAD